MTTATNRNTSTSCLMNTKLLLTGLVTCALAVGSHLRAEVPTNNTPFVQILATDPTALEGTSTGAFTLIRNDTNTDLVVDLAIHGTASNGVDYALIPNAVTIPAGNLSV